MSATLTLYVPRESPIHQLNPLTKLTAAAFLLVGGLTLPGIWSNYLFFALVILPLAWFSGVLKELVNKTWRVVLPFAISVFLIQGFLWPNGTPIFYIGPFSLKSEGLLFAITSTGRILVVVSSFLWFAFTTRPDFLMIALAERGLPGSLAYILVTTIQIIPYFQGRAATILDAQQARGLVTSGSLRRRFSAIVPLVVPLILGSLVDVEERALAIQARAFNLPGPKTSLIEIRQASWEVYLRLALAAGMLVFILARLFLLYQRIAA